MKRTLFIILAVVVVFLIIGFSFTRLSQRASTSDQFSRDLMYAVGSGGGSPPVVEMPAAEAPAPAFDTANSAVDLYSPESQAVQPQERLVIENADLAIVVK